MAVTDDLENIGDNVFTLLPLFHKKLLRGGDYHSVKNPPIQQYPTLGRLSWQGPTPISELARQLCISKPNMTSLIDRLVAEGKVKRLPDNKDRRIVKIAITEMGRNFMRGYKRAVKEVMKRNLSSMDEADLKTLSVSLENMKKILSKISDEGIGHG